MKNYYEILGLQQNATDDEIKTAYRKLSLKFHPDKNDGDTYFTEWTKRINKAYETLGNKDKRKAYDETLKSNNFKQSNTRSSNSHSSGSNRPSTSEYEVLSQIKKLTPEFLKAKSAYVAAKFNYDNIAGQEIPNKFSIARVLLIFLLFIVSVIGIKKTYFNDKLSTLKEYNTSKPTVKEVIGEPIKNVGNSILFISFYGIEDRSEVIAVPIAIYINGRYETPPSCEDEANEQQAIDQCEKAKAILLPSVSPGATLYMLNNGKKLNRIKVLNTKQFGYNHWKTYSALIQEKPQHYILTDNPKLGTNKLTTIKDRPALPRRKDPEDNILNDKLLTKVDIDGDGIPELIYECPDYDGTFYTIYSNKNGKWTKVYEGGYQGF